MAVTHKKILWFLLSAAFGRENCAAIKKAKTPDEIYSICLRVAWRDAFRHTTENVNSNYEHNMKMAQSICADPAVLDLFRRYLYAPASHRFGKVKGPVKAEVLENGRASLTAILGQVKKTTGAKAICFGHLQKWFNMAVKYYLILCIEQGALDLTVTPPLASGAELAGLLSEADCPIDSVILSSVQPKDLSTPITGLTLYGYNRFTDIVWSQMSDKDTYIYLQKVIASFPGGNNLAYDFDNWI